MLRSYRLLTILSCLILLCSLSLTSMLAPAPAYALTVISNPSFETPALGAGNDQYSPTGATWSFIGSSGISGNNSAFTSGSAVAPDGQQVVFLQQTGRIDQAFSFDGQAATLTYAAAQRAGAFGGQSIQVYLDNVLLDTYSPASTTYADHAVNLGVPSSGSHTLSIRGTNPGGGDHTAFVDNIRLISAGNLALGKTVTASSSLENADWGSSRLVDAQKTSVAGAIGYTTDPGFASATPAGGVWVNIDLGANQTITSVKLFPRTGTSSVGGGSANFPVDFTIQLAPGGGSYTAVQAIAGQANPNGAAQTYTFGATTARHIRLNVTRLGSPAASEPGSYRLQLAELEVYGNPPPGRIGAPSFETPVVGSGSFSYYAGSPGGAAWTFSSLSGISGNASAFTSGSAAAPNGQQVVFLQQTGTIDQVIPFDGQPYTLTYAAAQRSGSLGGQTLQVYLDGVLKDTYTPAGTNYTNRTVSLGTPSSGSHTLSIRGTNPGGGDHTAFIDNLRLTLSNALPYPTRTTIKGLQPDFWSNQTELMGANPGGFSMNMIWDIWEPTLKAPPCASGEELYDGHCFVIDTATDTYIRTYTGLGVVITGIVYGTPNWARASCTGSVDVRFCAPLNPADYARFAGYIARRYNGNNGNGRIASFVIMNEVNARDWFNVACNSCDQNLWIQTYADDYNAAYDLISAQQPFAKVFFSFEHHFGASYDNPAGGLLSVETFLGGKAGVAGLGARVGSRAWRVAYHPYGSDMSHFSADDYPQVTYGNVGIVAGWLRQKFPSVPSAWDIESTESGVSSVGASSESEQVTLICNGLRNILGTPGISNYIYHRMQDHPIEVAGGLALGLRRADGTAKPGWNTWRDANKTGTLACGFEALPYTQLKRYYHATRGHWNSSRLPPSGFTLEQSWRLYREAQSGSRLLYECGVAAHTRITQDSTCGSDQARGPVGYIFNANATGRVALYACRVNTVDHFVSASSTCEGQTVEGLLGYAVP